MSIFNEAEQAPQQLQASLAAGVKTLSNNQIVSFQPYTKYVLSEDGYVFWVKTGSPTSYSGSLHQAIERHQDKDQTIAVNRFIFTALEEVSQFNVVSPTTLLVGTWVIDGVTVQVVFDNTGTIYKQAGLWHYSGNAVYPALQAQLINSIDDLPAEPIVSNSLPIWLSQNSLAPVYPSYLVPDNIVPPYIVVHIPPEATQPLAQFPTYGWPGTQIGENEYQLSAIQLMQDRVELTLYGFNAQLTQQYLSSLMDYSLQTEAFGFANSPAALDEKRGQTEIAAIAMKKTIVILANYLRNTADAVIRRLILSSILNINLINFKH